MSTPECSDGNDSGSTRSRQAEEVNVPAFVLGIFLGVLVGCAVIATCAVVLAATGSLLLAGCLYVGVSGAGALAIVGLLRAIDKLEDQA